jgi:hypothetical protein
VIIEKRRIIRKLKPIAVKSKAFAFWYDAIPNRNRKVLTNAWAGEEYFYTENSEAEDRDDELQCEINPPAFIYTMAILIGISAYIFGSYLFS